MNKTEFIAAVAEEAGLSKTDAAKAVKAFTDVVTEEMKKGEKVQLIDLVTLKFLRDQLVKVSTLQQRKRSQLLQLMYLSSKQVRL